jgi:hypothetical protein
MTSSLSFREALQAWGFGDSSPMFPHASGYPTRGSDTPPSSTTGASTTAAPDDTGASFTESVASAAGPNANPRLAVIVASLVRHLHAFAREVNLTSEEWMEGVEFVSVVRKVSSREAAAPPDPPGRLPR